MLLAQTPLTPQALAFNALIDASLALPSEYDDQLSSHLPMALHALHCLGASSQGMQSFFDHYAARFKGIAATPDAEAAADWRVLKGQPQAYAVLRSSFMQRLERDGADAVLRSALPELLPGVAAAAFHGAIRVAHAVQSGHLGELAAALAYWAWRWQPLAEPDSTSPRLDFDVWAAQLLMQARTWRGQGGLIALRMDEATRSSIYRSLAQGPVLEDQPQKLLAQLAAHAAQLYAAAPNFTVLHIITGLRAIRVLMPWVTPDPGLQALLLRNYTAAVLAANIQEPAARPTAPQRDWPQVVAAALTSKNDHVIKLVHACVEEAAAYGDGQYLEVANLAVA